MLKWRWLACRGRAVEFAAGASQAAVSVCDSSCSVYVEECVHVWMLGSFWCFVR